MRVITAVSGGVLMKTRGACKVASLILAGFGVALFGMAINAQQVCFSETTIPDPGDPKCLKVPTSLPCLDPNLPNSDGWASTAGSQCGFKKGGIIRRSKPCGRNLADSPCVGGIPVA
jgi:hypothetical protein